MKVLIEILLFLIAYALYLPLCIANFFILCFKGGAKNYFLSSARSLDVYANREFRTLWNVTLRKPYSYEYGNPRETISGVTGKIQRDGQLTTVGKGLAWVLDTLDKDHCKNSINDDVNWEYEKAYEELIKEYHGKL